MSELTAESLAALIAASKEKGDELPAFTAEFNQDLLVYLSAHPDSPEKTNLLNKADHVLKMRELAIAAQNLVHSMVPMLREMTAKLQADMVEIKTGYEAAKVRLAELEAIHDSKRVRGS